MRLIGIWDPPSSSVDLVTFYFLKTVLRSSSHATTEVFSLFKTHTLSPSLWSRYVRGSFAVPSQSQIPESPDPTWFPAKTTYESRSFGLQNTFSAQKTPGFSRENWCDWRGIFLEAKRLDSGGFFAGARWFARVRGAPPHMQRDPVRSGSCGGPTARGIDHHCLVWVNVFMLEFYEISVSSGWWRKQKGMCQV